jgi:methylamine dehydrogenase light chain
MKTWLQNAVREGSRWLARNSSERGALAATASRVAGVGSHEHLPVDRRERLDPMHHAHDHPREVARVRPMSIADDPSWRQSRWEWPFGSWFGASGVNCSDNRYCHLHGYACACCGGTDTKCPTGTTRGHYWSFCCQHSTIWYVDCCGGNTKCPSSCPVCHNSNQPNWCLGYGGGQYICTLAEYQGGC